MLQPRTLYYGHAKTAVMDTGTSATAAGTSAPERINNLFSLTKRIMKYIDKGVSLEVIRKKTAADPVFIEDVARMYLTHSNVGVQGILDRIEIKGQVTGHTGHSRLIRPLESVFF